MVTVNSFILTFIDSATVVEVKVVHLEQVQFYIHYDGLDKRMDRWATSEELKHQEVFTQASFSTPIAASS